MDLVHAAVLEQVPARRARQLTATSLRAWMAGQDPGSTIVAFGPLTELLTHLVPVKAPAKSEQGWTRRAECDLATLSP